MLMARAIEGRRVGMVERAVVRRAWAEETVKDRRDRVAAAQGRAAVSAVLLGEVCGHSWPVRETMERTIGRTLAREVAPAGGEDG